MNQPLEYSKYNDFQKRNTIWVLENYFQLVKWHKDDKDVVLDVGCGVGDVTNDLLLPLFPISFSKLVAIDKSEQMVEFAKERYQNTQLSFEVMDITTEHVPVDFVEEFDHVFSFFCLHWVQDQRKGIENIWKMMKPRGDMLLTLVGTSPIYDIFLAQSQTERWQSYMENMVGYVSPYHNVEKPMRKLEEILKEVGFETHLCTVEEIIYEFANVEIFKEFLSSLNPFFNRIPEDLKADFFSDLVIEYKKINFCNVHVHGNRESFTVPCQTLIVYASKTFSQA